jgi:branched-chain amino acid transport system substrate-binding protein
MFASLLVLSVLLPNARAEKGVSAKEVQIGIVNQETGPIAASGLPMVAAYRAVFDQTNAAGGVNGRKIKAIFLDDAYEPAKTVAHTKRLVEKDDVFALAGYNATPTIRAVYPLISKGETPFLFGRTGDAFLQVFNPMIFNLRPGFDEEVAAVVKYLSAKTMSRVAIAYQPDGLGDGIKSSLVSALKGAGKFDPAKNTSPFVAEAVLQRGMDDQKVFDSAFAKLEAGKPDVVFLGVATAGAAPLIKLGIKNKVKWQWVAMSNAGALIELLDGGTDPNVLMSQIVPNPYASKLALVGEFRDTLKKAGQEKYFGYNAFEAYIGARILIEALRRAGPELTRTKFISAMEGAAFEIGGYANQWTPQNHNGNGKVYLSRIKDSKMVDVD